MKRLTLFLAVVVTVFCFSTLAFGKALLIENVTPWPGSGQSNEVTLTQLDLEFDKVSSNVFRDMTDLSGYDYIVYSSDQNQIYYNDIAANFDLIDNYVFDGGVLLAHACVIGWNGGTWDFNAGTGFLPGGVKAVLDYSNSVTIADPTSPVIDGWVGVVTEASLQSWGYSTHGYFTDMVAGTNVIISMAGGGAYIEYAYGAGIVRASMLTMEWNQGPYAGDRDIFRQNEYLYQVKGDPKAVPEPSTMLLLGFGLVGLAVSGRKLRK